jgi:uncharacterized protein YdaU (DUF1376 family)
MKSPAFQFYAADFLVGTMGMSDEEIGIYIKMLAVQWERGSLPNDRKLIKKLINSRKVPSEMVLHKFAISDDGFLKNSRLEKEREKQTTFRESRVKNAQKRWDKEKPDDALASSVHPSSTSETHALQSSSSSSSSSSDLREREKSAHAPGKAPSAQEPASDNWSDSLPTASASDFRKLEAWINSLHPSWKKRPHFSRIEREELLANSRIFFDLTDRDKALLARYIDAAIDESWGKFWQPDQRGQLVRSVLDVLSHADRWEKECRKRNCATGIAVAAKEHTTPPNEA